MAALHATLRSPALAHAEVAQVAEVPASLPRPLPDATAAPRAAQAQPQPTAVLSRPAEAAERPLAGSTTVVPERSAAVAGTAAKDVQSTGPASRTPALDAAAGGLDADGLRQYRLALAREARRFKRYPEGARLEGAAGTAEVRIELDAGRAPMLRLVRSSGHSALDNAALEMLRQAAPRTALPETLSRRSFAISLPVVFDLDQD